MGSRNYVEKVKEYSSRCKSHLKEYRQEPIEMVKSDIYAFGRNIRDNHGKRMAAAMALSGFTTPLKCYLETSGKNIMHTVYEISPDLIQKGADLVYYSVPESMNWLLNFSTTGEEMSDLSSILARVFSISTGYVFGQFVFDKIREKPFQKLGLRKPGFMRGIGKATYDFNLAMTLGGLWEYLKYTGVQCVIGNVDSSKTTNSTMTVLFPTALMNIIRGWLLDVSGELVDYRDSERTPEWLKNKSKRFKKDLFHGLCLGALAGSVLVYYFNHAPFFPSDVEERNLIIQEGSLDDSLRNGLKGEIVEEDILDLRNKLFDYDNLENLIE